MIQSRSGKCLDNSSNYLDLSKSNIVAVGKLNEGQFIQVLNLSKNCLQDIMNIGLYSNLWKLDLSHNKVKSLTGLVNFIVLGVLNLSYNQITWSELLKIQHIHILDLNLHGNPHLTKDSYYQIHVIDSLPNCWVLDGSMITTGDRFHVTQFFKQAERQKQSLRHKIPKTNFFPSYLKKVRFCGIFGSRAAHVLTTFPLNTRLNKEIDRKRLQYMAFNIQEIIALENPQCDVIKNYANFLEQILELRENNREQSNVLFLLLLASLEFCIPSQTIVEMLSVTNLHKCGNIFTVDIFLMPREIRAMTVGLLFNAIKLDNEDNVDAGVYKHLFLYLTSNVPDLLKFTTSKSSSVYKTLKNQCNKDYRFLLAAELCQVLMLVPSFYHHLQMQDSGLLDVIIEATSEKEAQEIVNKVLESQFRDRNDFYEEEEEEDENLKFGTAAGSWQRELNEMLAGMIQNHFKVVISKEPELSPSEKILYLNPFNNKPIHRQCVIQSNQNENIVQAIPLPPSRHKPRIGESVILGKQVFGKIIALPSYYIAKVYIDGVLEPNGSIIKRVKDSWKHYKTINLNNMEWDSCEKCWRWKMPNNKCKQPVVMDPVSRASESSEDKEMLEQPDKCMISKSDGCKSLTYTVQPKPEKDPYYVACTDLDQQPQLQDPSYLPESEINIEQSDMKVVIQTERDSNCKENLDSKNSELENAKSSPGKTKLSDYELLVLSMEPPKRPHSALPILQGSKIELMKEFQNYPFRMKPLSTRKNEKFSKYKKDTPESCQIRERNVSTPASDVPYVGYLSGGDASCRQVTTGIASVESRATINSLTERNEPKKEQHLKYERPKSECSNPGYKSHVQVVRGENWLANGRNLFEESKQKYLKRSIISASWKNSMISSYKSADTKVQCPFTAFRVTRLNCPVKGPTRSLAVEGGKMQQNSNTSFNDKKSLKNKWSSSQISHRSLIKESKEKQNEENGIKNRKQQGNLNFSSQENKRIQFSSSPMILEC